jgi:hypothetical protein
MRFGPEAVVRSDTFAYSVDEEGAAATSGWLRTCEPDKGSSG